jgi:hypothetical protein
MPLFGQDILWTTGGINAMAGNTRVISMSQVKAEILKFAGQYDLYSELPRYSFDNHPSGNGWVFSLDLQLNDNKGMVSAMKAPLNGRQTVSFSFIHKQGIDELVFHDGVITGGISTSNRRSLEALIDRLIANCR